MGTNRRGSFIPAVTLGMVACLVAGLTAAGCSSEVPSLATSSAGTVDVTAVPVDSSLPAAVEIAVTVGVDSATDRVESIPLGATVKLTLLDPAAAEEYHVHGYELGDGVEIAKGVPEVFQFVANKPGDFEVESHKTETVLVILKVG